MKHDKPVFLFDAAGRPYRFANEREVSHHRVDARTFCGVAATTGQAPPEVARCRPESREHEVSGRHLNPDSEFYHTGWEWGDLEFDGQDGLTGSYFCCHAHYSRVDARAIYDPSCDMLPVAAGDADPGSDEFAVRF